MSAEFDAFFKLHQDLPREGPGDDASFAWAMALAKPPRDARILDAGCGPGDDIARLLDAAPQGHVTAVDAHAPFIEAASARHLNDPRVEARVGDMANPGGLFDMIWCAGALYFLGVESGLRQWRDVLAADGVVAFSDAIWTTPTPSEVPRSLMAEYSGMTYLEGDLRACDKAGYEVLGYQMLGDEAWEAYYQPIEERIAQLRPGAEAALSRVLDEAEHEIETWRKYRDEFGYVQIVARKR